MTFSISREKRRTRRTRGRTGANKVKDHLLLYLSPGRMDGKSHGHGQTKEMNQRLIETGVDTSSSSFVREWVNVCSERKLEIKRRVIICMRVIKTASDDLAVGRTNWLTDWGLTKANSKAIAHSNLWAVPTISAPICGEIDGPRIVLVVLPRVARFDEWWFFHRNAAAAAVFLRCEKRKKGVMTNKMSLHNTPIYTYNEHSVQLILIQLYTAFIYIRTFRFQGYYFQQPAFFHIIAIFHCQRSF